MHRIDGTLGNQGFGFGGCTVSIVKDEAVDTFIKEVGAAYEKKIGYAADFYVTLGSRCFGVCGVAVGIPSLRYWNSNLRL